jgi:hypothetical protein
VIGRDCKTLVELDTLESCDALDRCYVEVQKVEVRYNMDP